MAVYFKISMTAAEMNTQSKGNPSSVLALNFFAPGSILVPFAANLIRFARVPVLRTASTWHS